MNTEHKIRVLLIDDQMIVGEQVRRMLAEHEDIEYLFCQEPAKAIPTALEFKPTVILQDLVMPDIDGMTLVRFYRAKEELKDVPLIVLSSKEEAATKAEAFALGANDYMVKLPDQLEILARIRYHSKGYIALLERNEAYDALKKSQDELAAELAYAAEYVESLLPAVLPPPALPNTEWKFVPSEKLGGDSFGYHWIDDDHFAIYLLDVCNHGVGPALLSVAAINTLRGQTLPGVDFRNVKDVMQAMNILFEMEQHNNLYFTMWYGVFNKNTRQLDYSSAGHPPSLLFNPADQSMEQLSKPNIFIGAFEETDFITGTTTVPADASLFVFSDGVYEVEMPEGMWAFDDFVEYMKQPPPADQTVADALYDFVYSRNGKPYLDDDYSMMRINL